MTRYLREHAGRAWIVIVLAGQVGCGLADYDKFAEKQRTRVQKFDAINRLLDDPIEIPTIQTQGSKTDTPAWSFEVFLRLPKGYGSTVREKDKVPYNYPFPCFRYVGGDIGNSFFVAAAFVSKTKDVNKFGEYTPEFFRYFVKQALEDYCLKTSGAKLHFSDKGPSQEVEVKAFVPWSGDETKIAYDLVTYSESNPKLVREPVAFDAYFHKDSDRQICIVVQRPIALVNEPAYRKTLDACLGSLDMSTDAANRRVQVLKAKRR